MSRVYNFSAGPSMLPEEVLLEAKKEHPDAGVIRGAHPLDGGQGYYKSDSKENPWSLPNIARIKSEFESDPEKTKQKYPEIFYYYDGMIDTKISQSVHPAGMVISPITLDDNYGTFDKEGEKCLMMDMEEAHEVGAAKYDFLVLKTVQVIRDACNYLGQPYPKTHEVNWDDQEVWSDMAKSLTAIFQFERMEDLGEAQNFRVEMAKHKCSEAEARKLAKENIFSKTVVFGLGMTGLFIADQIKRNHPDAQILFVGRSDENCKKVTFSKEIAGADYLCTSGLSEEETAEKIMEKIGGRATMFVGTSGSNVEHRIAFQHKVLGCNGVYNSFSLGPVVSYDTMPFGFENHLIFASINFRQEHMEKAIDVLVDSRYDEVVELIEKDEFIKDPLQAYENKIFCKGAPLKTGVIWNEKYIEEGK